MGDRHRSDDPFDRLLRHQLRAADDTGNVCPDADTIAAYADGVSSDQERRAVDAHLATCGRCAHVLALTLSAEAVPAATAAGRAAFPGLWRWLAPAAAAAAGVAIWVAVDDPGRTPGQAPQMARSESVSAPVPATDRTVPAAPVPSASAPSPSEADVAEGREAALADAQGQLQGRAPGQRLGQGQGQGQGQGLPQGQSSASARTSTPGSAPAEAPPSVPPPARLEEPAAPATRASAEKAGAAGSDASPDAARAQGAAARAQAEAARSQADAQVTGARAESVTVSATPPPSVDIQNARQRQVFSGDDLRDLPTTRDLGALVQLVPGVSAGAGVNAQVPCAPAGSAADGTAPSTSTGAQSGCAPVLNGFNSFSAVNDAGALNQGRIQVDGVQVQGAAGNTSPAIADTANAQEVTFTLAGSLGESETGGSVINVVPQDGQAATAKAETSPRADAAPPAGGGARAGRGGAGGGRGGGAGGRGAAPASPAQQAGASTGAAADTAVRRAEQAAVAAAPPVVVATPDGNVVWRARGVIIERSANGGVSWTAVHTATEPLAGGAAPARDIVWFYGAKGTILRLVQGAWRSSTAPSGSPVASLQATDGDSASIRLSDGRAYTTNDGGATWMPR